MQKNNHLNLLLALLRPNFVFPNILKIQTVLNLLPIYNLLLHFIVPSSFLPLTNTLHGAAYLGGNPEELAEIPARHLHHTVVQTRLKICRRRVCH